MARVYDRAMLTSCVFSSMVGTCIGGFCILRSDCVPIMMYALIVTSQVAFYSNISAYCAIWKDAGATWRARNATEDLPRIFQDFRDVMLLVAVQLLIMKHEKLLLTSDHVLLQGAVWLQLKCARKVASSIAAIVEL